MGLFDRKYCDICGEKISLLGNRKLEDGNLCKNCARKLSPWFEERRHSTVEEIRKQLEYREENKARVEQFNVTREIGGRWRVLIDETHGWVILTSVGDYKSENPDILEFSQITGCEMDIDEDRSELMREGADGKKVSYNPPRYVFAYDFRVKVTVNSPYFNEIRMKLNSDSVELVSELPKGYALNRRIDPSYSVEYRKYKQKGDEICETLKQLSRQQVQQTVKAEEILAAVEPAVSAVWNCAACGAQNSGKFCEYCGTARP